MNGLAEHSADQLRRLLVEQRREVVALNAEFNRLQDVRRGAPPVAAERLLHDLDVVGARPHDATTALDKLTDALIRKNREYSIRTARSGARRRFSWRTVAH